MYTCTIIYMYIYTVFVYIYICICTCNRVIYMYIFVYIYICTYIYIYIYALMYLICMCTIYKTRCSGLRLLPACLVVWLASSMYVLLQSSWNSSIYIICIYIRMSICLIYICLHM